MQNTVTSETAVLETITFERVTFRPDAAPAVKTRRASPRLRKLGRSLLLKWDMIAIVALIFASAVYGVYAVFFLTGF